MRRHEYVEPGIASRFGLAWERLAAQDAATSEWLSRHSQHPDPDEDPCLDLATCKACEEPLSRRGSRICHACSLKGWRPAPCISCGGLTTNHDRSNKKKQGRLYGMCRKCREATRRAA